MPKAAASPDVIGTDAGGLPIVAWAEMPDPYAPRHYSSYEGAKINRLNRDWIPPHRSGDLAIFDSWFTLTPRVRDLLRNNATVIGAQAELKTNVIGTGIQTFADAAIVKDDGTQDAIEDFNDESDYWFEQWAEEEADVEGKLSWQEMQGLAFGEAAGVGETLLLRCQRNDRNRVVPLCYQVIEPEQLDWTRDRPPDQNGVRIMRGIEMDSFDRPIAYWLYDTYPWDGFTGWDGKSYRIPADRVIHPFVKFRPSQSRGISWYAPIVQPARDLDWYIGNELTAAAIGALLTVLVKRATPNRGGMGLEPDADHFGNELVKLGKGIVGEIGADDDVKIVESNRPNPDAAPFIKLLQGQCGSAINGMTYLGLTGDFTAASYTAARAAFLKDQAKYRVLQSWFARKTVKPVRREFTRQAIAYDVLRNGPTVNQFNRQPRRWLGVEAMGPGNQQLDEEKETDAAGARIRMGMSSGPRECAKLGLPWKKVQREQAAFMKHADKLGLQYDFSKGASPPKNGQVGSDPDSGQVPQKVPAGSSSPEEDNV
jgi:lambda family phage portal protein